MYRKRLGIYVDRIDHASHLGVVARFPAVAGPGLRIAGDLVFSHLWHCDRFHHLADDTVHDEEDRDTVQLGLVICKLKDIDRFLDGRRSIGQQMVVAVSAALGGLVVIAL